VPFSKQAKVISATVFCSCDAFSAERRGAYVARGKWIRGKLYELSKPDSCEEKSINDLRNKIGLELVQVDIEGTVEAERGSDR
jgi:hypothetical protein